MTERVDMLCEVQPEMSPRLEELEAQLVDARQAHARNLERLMASSWRSRTDSDINIQNAYERVRIAYGKELLGNELAVMTDVTERRARVIQYLVDQDKILDAEMTDPTALTRGQKMRRRGRAAIARVGAWASRGSRKQQLAKGMLVGGVAAMAFGTFAGAGVAAAGMAGVRFMRGYSQQEAKEVKDLQTITQESVIQGIGEDVDPEKVGDIFQRASDVISDHRAANILKHQEHHTAAIKKGIGVAALGAVLGSTLGGIVHEAAFAADSAYAEVVHPAPDQVTIGSVDVSTGYETAGAVDMPMDSEATGVASSDTPGSIDIPLGADTAGHVDIPVDVVTTGSLDVPPVAVVSGNVDIPTGPVATGDVAIPALSLGDATGSGYIVNLADSTGVVDIPGGVDATGSVDMHSVGTETTGQVDLPAVSEAEGNVDIPAQTGETVGTVDIPGANEVALQSSFTVETGHGYVHELMDTAKAAGVPIVADQAWELHQQLVDTYGSDYINYAGDHTGADVYGMGDSQYEVGLSHAGSAIWDAGAAQDIQDYLSDADSAPSADTSAPVSADTYETAGSVNIPPASFSDQDWSDMESMLQAAAEQDTLNQISQQNPSLMNGIGPVLSGMVYPDGSPIVDLGSNGVWYFNDSDYALSTQALDRIHTYLDARGARLDTLLAKAG